MANEISNDVTIDLQTAWFIEQYLKFDSLAKRPDEHSVLNFIKVVLDGNEIGEIILWKRFKILEKERKIIHKLSMKGNPLIQK